MYGFPYGHVDGACDHASSREEGECQEIRTDAARSCIKPRDEQRGQSRDTEIIMSDRKRPRGRLKAVEIFETLHPRNTAGWNLDWKTMWDGQPLRHRLPGKDSGEWWRQ